MVPFYYILLTIFPLLRMPVSNELRSLTTHPQPCGTPTTYGIIRLPALENSPTQHFSVHTTSHLQGNSDDSVDTNI